MRPSALTPACLILSAVLALSACGDGGSSPGPTVPASPSGPTVGESGGATTERPSPSPAATDAPSPTPPVTPAPTGEVTTYTVASGDTLFSIARRFGTTVPQLQAWNADRHPSLADDANRLEAGWVLVVAGEPGVTPIPTPAGQPSSPKPTPPPSGAGCTAGNRVAAGSAQTFARIPNAGSGVALTLDMGGRLDPALDILRFLIDNRVCATIFPTGAMAQTPIGKQVMAVIKAHPELFEVGNHTMHHCDLVRGGAGSPSTAPCAGVTPTAEFIRKQLTDAETILRDGTGQNPQPYWRPPYGSTSQAVVDAAASAGYTKTFMWDIDTIDWKPVSEGGPSAEQIAAKVIGNAVGGSNVLFHLGGYETLDALRLIVPALRDRGLTPTSLSDLLS
jgi:peptidoglycan/xylan/chitin deacetylase (PgdA/CDA1 family)